MPKQPRKPVPPPEGSLWIKEAASYLGVAVRTLYSWRYADHGPKSYDIGRKVAYQITELDSYLTERQNPKPPEPAHESRPAEPRRATRKHRTPAAA